MSQKRSPDEHKDAETFFRKTYLTQGLENLHGKISNQEIDEKVREAFRQLGLEIEL